MTKKIQNFLINAALLILAVLFVIKFAGPSFLKAYVNTGIGDCKKNPVLCIAPDVEITNPPINQDYKFGLVPYSFPKMRIYLPKGFNVVQEEMKKFYYTRDARKYSGPAVYLLYEKPGFFLKLFPQVAKKEVPGQPNR